MIYEYYFDNILMKQIRLKKYAFYQNIIYNIRSLWMNGKNRSTQLKNFDDCTQQTKAKYVATTDIYSVVITENSCSSLGEYTKRFIMLKNYLLNKRHDSHQLLS